MSEPIYKPIEPQNEDYYEQNERAAIMQYDGGLSERDADQQAHLIMCRKRIAEAVVARRMNEAKVMGRK
jgi:hypothetical protein